MQVEKQRKMPETLRKKLERDTKLAEQAKEQARLQEEQNKKNQAYYLQKGKEYYEANEKSQTDLVNLKREAKANSSFYVEEQPKFFLVVRIKGINKVPPKEKMILQLIRLRQLGNAVFLKNNKATMNMLRRVEPWVTYGRPSRRVVKNLVYKRGYGKLNKQRIPLSNNQIVEAGLGQYGIKCVEDLINEINNFGENFKAAANFLWPFKLDSAKGGLKKKRQPYLNGGDFGPRENYINDLVERML